MAPAESTRRPPSGRRRTTARRRSRRSARPCSMTTSTASRSRRSTRARAGSGSNRCRRCTGATSGGGHAMATAELTVIGLGRSDPSAGEYIAEIQRRLGVQEKVRYQLQAMGTELEGSTDDILAVVAELHRVPFELGLPRVYTVLKLDERRDKEQTLEDKVRSVEERLKEYCRGWDSNPHAPEGTIGLKPIAS